MRIARACAGEFYAGAGVASETRNVIKHVIIGRVVETAPHGLVLTNVGYKKLLGTDKATKFSWLVRVANYSDWNFGLVDVSFEFLKAPDRNWEYDVLFRDVVRTMLGPSQTVNVENMVSIPNVLAELVAESMVQLGCENIPPEDEARKPAEIKRLR